LKKSPKSMAEQLAGLQLQPADSPSQKVKGENNSTQIKTPIIHQTKTYSKIIIKSSLPCKDLTSNYLLLRFETENAAVEYREQLWDSASISSKELVCERCGGYHLLDVYGLRLVGKEKLQKKLHQYIYQKNFSVREKCSICVSAEGKPKAIFKSLRDAQDSLDSLSFDVPHDMYAYNCPALQGVHLTKQSPRIYSQTILTLRQSRFIELLDNEPKVIITRSVVPNEDKVKKTLKIVGSSNEIDMTKVSKSKYLLCLACNHRGNLYTDRKCGFCGKLGPYEWM